MTPPPTSRSLFGGAITLELPPPFLDVSPLRSIPDNQEVFSEASTDRSVIIELLQLEPTHTPSLHHFEHLTSDAGAQSATPPQTTSLTPSQALLSDDPETTITLTLGTHIVSKYRDEASKANRVNIYLACIRLPRSNTDLLITFNDPVILHPESTSAKLGSSVATPEETDLNKRASILLHAVNSLRILDWTLFTD